MEYLNNKVFENIILEYKDCIVNQTPRTSEVFIDIQLELTKAFYSISKNLIRKYKFSNVDRDDALQEGVLICFEKIERFDPTLGSKAFNFCTTIILNHFRQLYRYAKNQSDLKKRYQQHILNQKNNVSRNRGKKKKIITNNYKNSP